MNGLPYYKAYPRDFIEGTIGMSFELKGAYRLVLDLIYMQGGNLPDDPRYISGLLGVSVRKWNSFRDDLLSLGKIQVSGEFLTNYRALSELESLAKLQDKQAENRSRPNKNKGLASPRSNHTEPEPEPYDDKDKSSSSCAADGLNFSEEDFSALLTAVGFDPNGHIPEAWRVSGMDRVRDWLALGLDADRIISAAADFCKRFTDLPATPQALNKAMDLEAARPAKPKPLTHQEILQREADMINGDGYCSAALITPSRARELIHLKLVTPERMRERGIAA
jgi:uncharacterized protein YdaU (DUF1376 family)